MKKYGVAAAFLIGVLFLPGCGIYTSKALPMSDLLTKAQAEAIALEHAGFTAQQVYGLRSEADMDSGIPHYEVEFRVGQWEYDYDIHAETGEVLSFEKDD